MMKLNRAFSRSGVRTTLVAAFALSLAGCSTIPGFGPSAPEGPTSYTEKEKQRELRLAAAARASGQLEAAVNIYQKLLRAEPDAPAVRAALAETLFEQGANARAVAEYDHALSGPIASDDVKAAALVGRGRAYLALGRPAAAERDFDFALGLRPASAVALNGRGVAADMQGRHGEAQDLYRMALAHDPGNERVRSNLGLSFALAARFDDAVAELAPIAAIADRAPKARHNLALAFGLMGEGEKAKKLTNDSLGVVAAEGNSRFYAAMRDAVQPDETTASKPHPEWVDAAKPGEETPKSPAAKTMEMKTSTKPKADEPESIVRTDDATGALVFDAQLNLLETTTGR